MIMGLSHGIFLLIWFGFLVLMLVCVGAVFIWAIRTGQFSRQDRARYLPLDQEDRVREEGKGDCTKKHGDAERSKLNP